MRWQILHLFKFDHDHERGERIFKTQTVYTKLTVYKCGVTKHEFLILRFQLRPWIFLWIFSRTFTFWCTPNVFPKIFFFIFQNFPKSSRPASKSTLNHESLGIALLSWRYMWFANSYRFLNKTFITTITNELPWIFAWLLVRTLKLEWRVKLHGNVQMNDVCNSAKLYNKISFVK